MKKYKNKGEYRVLLLASYCGNDNTECTEYSPCVDCLAMCNTFMIDDEAIKTDRYAGTLNYLRELK